MWLVWAAQLWLIVGNTAAVSFTVGLAVLYYFFLTDVIVQIGLIQLGADTLDFFVPMIAAATMITVVHASVIIYWLAPVARHIGNAVLLARRSSNVRVGPTTISLAQSGSLQNAKGTITPNKTSKACLCTRRTAARITSWGSRHSDEITRLFMLWEIVLQTFQAYKISYLVASVSINRLIALVIVTNCWFSPLLHHIMGRRPVDHVQLGRLMLDSSLDFIYNILIPLSIFYPYYRDYDGSVSLYPVVFYYDDTWYVNAVSELRQIFVTSWLDFISKITGSLSLVYGLWAVQSTMHSVYQGKKPTTHKGIIRGETEPAAQSTKAPRSRLTRLLDLVLVLWGATIFSLHLAATITSYRFHDPDCLLEMRPWGSLAYSCTSFEISCSKRHTTGDRETMETTLRTVDPLSVQNLILSNCPLLHVPTAIQRLKYLSMMKIYNSTIASWDTAAALRQVYHPQLQVIYFARVNTSAIPDGLLADDFPRSVWDIEFCITNISTFPEAITTAWAKVGIVSLEGNTELTEIPDVLIALPSLFTLGLAMNNISSIREGIFGTHDFVGIFLMGNPIKRLPDNIGRSIDQLTVLSFIGTEVAAIPTSWMDIAVPASKLPGSVILDAAWSPLCQSVTKQNVTRPKWLDINCETAEDPAYSYPVDAEDVWRRTNQRQGN